MNKVPKGYRLVGPTAFIRTGDMYRHTLTGKLTPTMSATADRVRTSESTITYFRRIGGKLRK